MGKSPDIRCRGSPRPIGYLGRPGLNCSALFWPEDRRSGAENERKGLRQSARPALGCYGPTSEALLRVSGWVAVAQQGLHLSNMPPLSRNQTLNTQHATPNNVLSNSWKDQPVCRSSKRGGQLGQTFLTRCLHMTIRKAKVSPPFLDSCIMQLFGPACRTCCRECGQSWRRYFAVNQQIAVASHEEAGAGNSGIQGGKITDIRVF